jgi:hypothetical protein
MLCLRVHLYGKVIVTVNESIENVENIENIGRLQFVSTLHTAVTINICTHVRPICTFSVLCRQPHFTRVN